MIKSLFLLHLSLSFKSSMPNSTFTSISLSARGILILQQPVHYTRTSSHLANTGPNMHAPSYTYSNALQLSLHRPQSRSQQKKLPHLHINDYWEKNLSLVLMDLYVSLSHIPNLHKYLTKKKPMQKTISQEADSRNQILTLNAPIPNLLCRKKNTEEAYSLKSNALPILK